MSDTTLSLLVLKSNDIEKLCAFYRVLGIEFTQEQHGKGPIHYAGQVQDVVLEIYPLGGEYSVIDTTTRLGFTVRNLDESIVTLEAMNGVAIITRPQRTNWGYRAVVRDPDGRTVELYGR